MKAAVITAPGVIEILDVHLPAPGPGEVLLRVGTSALCGTDQRVLRGEKAVDVPIIGHELVGFVEAIGEGVQGVQVGERYAVMTIVGCMECKMCKRNRQNLCERGIKAIGYQWNGGFAEYMIMPKEGVEQGLLIPVPDDMSDAVATLVEPLSCCVNGMDYLPLGDMDHVVIMSAGIIAVLNGLVARARGAKNITIMNRSQGRLDLINRLGLPFDNLVNTSQHDPVKWVKENTRGGADGVVVAASAKELVPVGVQMLGMGGHLSVFAGFAKNDPMEALDLNLIHYRELNIHGASGSARSHYFDALDLLKSDLIDWESIITHRFALGDFVEAFETQKNPDVDSLKILIQP